MKYSIVTFGCRVNQADSMSFEDGLRRRGATATPPDEADLVIVNTCSVTASADQGARQAIRRIARVNPAARLVVTGCYATRRPGELANLPNVAHVISNLQKDDLLQLIDDEIGPTTAERFAGEGDGACGGLEPGASGRTALTLRVQTGCEEQCSYCIIPQTRGVSSRPLEQVLSEIRRAVSAGYKEIVITGVHLGSYGRDLEEAASLTVLMRRLAAWEDDVRFRISSLEPMDCTTEIVDLVAASPRLAAHFHLPLQHGSDAMLRAMGRPYSVDDYRALAERIRAQIPDASIGSDIIVGFPGEGDADFSALHETLESLPLSHLHVFPYSDRPGTAASRLDAKVDGAVIRERARLIREIGTRLSVHFRATQMGRQHRALTVDDGSSAVTGNYLKVRMDVPRARNEWVDVRIEHADPLTASVVG